MTLDVPIKYQLTDYDIEYVLKSVHELYGNNVNPADPSFYDNGWAFRTMLSPQLVEFLDTFRRTEPSAAIIVSGFPVDDAEIGPTPKHWKEAAQRETTWSQELFMALSSLILGDAFSWSTLQSGRMIHNVLPIKGDENEQSGHGSEALLECHTEDAFHPYSCDYLMLFGVRNHDAVPTSLASLRDITLSDAEREILSQPRFHILPDEEHIRQLSATGVDHPGLARMIDLNTNPPLVPILFGDPKAPYIRIDPYFMRLADDDPEAATALQSLVEKLKDVLQDIVINQGELLIVDNYSAVHGRKSFRARYDGKDRWLKKIIVTRDLRKSRTHRLNAQGRVLY